MLAEGGDCFTPAGLRTGGALVADERGNNGFKLDKPSSGGNGEIGAKLGKGDSVGSGGKLIAFGAVGLGMVVVCTTICALPMGFY